MLVKVRAFEEENNVWEKSVLHLADGKTIGEWVHLRRQVLLSYKILLHERPKFVIQRQCNKGGETKHFNGFKKSMACKKR